MTDGKNDPIDASHEQDLSHRASLRIFVCYRRLDSEERVYGLRDSLVAQGFRSENIFFDQAQEPGVNYPAEIERSLAACHVLVAVVGPAWLEAADADGRRLDDPRDWLRRELEAAITGNVPMRPVLVGRARMPEARRLPASLQAFADTQAIELPVPPGAHEQLVVSLDKLALAVAAREYSANCNLGAPNQQFVGRDRLFAEIANKLQPNDNGSSGRVAIVGLPGLGKTQLARAYAHRHRDDYRIVWEVPAQQRTTCVERFGALAQRLEMPQGDEGNPAKAVRETLERSDDWLLIFDNATSWADAEDMVLEDLVPRCGGHVIITSQRADWDDLGLETMPIDAMSKDDAVALLRSRMRGRVSSKDAARLGDLADLLMRIPLALEQAAAYMRKQRTSVAGLIKLVREHAPEILDREAPDDYDRTLASAWRLALAGFEEAAELEARGAVELLNLCAYLGPDDIPLMALAPHAGVLPEPLAGLFGRPLDLATAVGLMADYSHVRWSDSGTVERERVSLHRQVQFFTRARLGEADRLAWSESALRIVLAAFPEDPGDVKSWELCAAVLPHATAALEMTEELRLLPLARARLLDRMGQYLQSRAQFKQADIAYRQALEALPEYEDDERSLAATVRNHLGSLLRELGDFEGAYASHASALAVHEEICGPDSPEVADDSVNLGRVLIERDDFAIADRHFENALRIRTKLHGRNHRAVSECLSTLFFQRLRSGNVLDARPYLTQALDVLGALGLQDHPDAISFRFLDHHLFGVDAEPVPAHARLGEAVAVLEATYGEQHPDLAEWRQWQGDELLRDRYLDEAMTQYAKALEIDEAAYGPRHWKVARDLLRIFLIQACEDDDAVTRETLRRATGILQGMPVASGRDEERKNGGLSAFVLTKFDEALDCLGAMHAAVRPFERIGEIVSGTWGEDSPLYGAALQHFGMELQEANRRDYLVHAKTTLERATSILAAHYGADHPRVARCICNLGAAQLALGDVDGAESSYEYALAVLDAIEEPNQLQLMTALTGAYLVQAKIEQIVAMRAAEQPIPAELEGQSPPADDPSRAKRMASETLARARAVAQGAVGVGPLIRFAETLSTAGHLDEALEIHQQVLDMLEDAYGHDATIAADWRDRTGLLYEQLGKLEEALETYDSALAIHLARFGPEHANVVEDLRRRAIALAGLGRTGAAQASLERALAIAERTAGEDDDTSLRRVAWWLALGDAARDPAIAAHLYRVGLETGSHKGASGWFRARLGGLSAAEGDIPGAVDHLLASVLLLVAEQVGDPFWSVVRAALPAAGSAEARLRLHNAICVLKEDPAMQEHQHEFRPTITAALPRDWHAKESMTLLAPDGQANVIASSEPLDAEIDTVKYADVQGELLAKEFPDYEQLVYEECEIFGGRRGFLRQFEWTPPDGVRVTQMQLYYAEDGRGYTATATTPTENFANVEVDLRQLLAGLRLGL